jgi:hypothetical protein
MGRRANFRMAWTMPKIGQGLGKKNCQRDGLDKYCQQQDQEQQTHNLLLHIMNF